MFSHILSYFAVYQQFSSHFCLFLNHFINKYCMEYSEIYISHENMHKSYILSYFVIFCFISAFFIALLLIAKSIQSKLPISKHTALPCSYQMLVESKICYIVHICHILSCLVIFCHILLYISNFHRTFAYF